MSITQIHRELSKIGAGLLAKLKYGISFHYDRYDYISTRFEKQNYLQSQTYHTLYKTISK